VHKFCGLEAKLVKKTLGGPPSSSELLEVAERLHEARVVKVAYPGRQGAATDALAGGGGHLPAQAFFVAAAQRLPLLELAVGDSVLARALAESHKQIADRFFPVDDEGVGALY
jgi:hypothetical protein